MWYAYKTEKQLHSIELHLHDPSKISIVIGYSRADSNTSTLRFQGPKTYPANFVRFRLVQTLVYQPVYHQRPLPGTGHFRLKRDDELPENQLLIYLKR